MKHVLENTYGIIVVLVHSFYLNDLFRIDLRKVCKITVILIYEYIFAFEGTSGPQGRTDD